MRFRDPGYTPAFRDVPELLELLATTADDAEAKLAERAVLRLDRRHAPRAVAAAVARARASSRPGRGRLTRLVGRMALAFEDDTARAWLLEALADADPKTRHGAARAIAKLPPTTAAARAVVEAWDRGDEEDRRALADALGRIGGEEARERLARATGDKAVRASLVLERSEARQARADAIDADAALAHRARVRFHSRAGLEPVVAMELGEEWSARIAAPGVVEATLHGPLSRALAVRTATHVSFPIEPRPFDGLAETIVASLVSAPSLDVLRTFTRGRPIRFRLAWARGGHRRALAWRCAELVRGATRDLVNDPRESTWEVVVDDSGGRVALDLVPRGHVDARFSYRRSLVPAASHPTIAAAIARVAPRAAGDVVWDPFAGSGAELVERAYLGPYAKLIGTDVDPDAVRAASENLSAAGVANAVLDVADALSYSRTLAGRVSAVLTNPPMGRRVQRGGHRELLEKFVEHAAAVLAPGGALVWTVPEPRRIRARAAEVGLVLERSFPIDMGGFPADLAVYRKRV